MAPSDPSAATDDAREETAAAVTTANGMTPVPTMRDIARAAGVSQSTVSRVLNDTSTRVPIAAETRERVVREARRLGYRPNPHARSLRGASTMLLGALVRDFSDPFWAQVIEVLAVAAMARGYNVVLGHAQGRLEEAIALTTVLETRHTDAIILLGDYQDQPRLVADLRESIVPVVALWQGSSPILFPSADVDEPAGIFIGLEHLIELGHRRIALVSAYLAGDNLHRHDAFVQSMTERFGSIPEGYIQSVPNTLAGGEAALRALLDRPDVPTAIIATTDLVAVGVLHAAYNLGRTVPSQLSVVGFDDILIAAHTVPALTTIRMPIAQIVGRGVEMALDPTASREPHIVRFTPSLVVRQSTAPPPD